MTKMMKEMEIVHFLWYRGGNTQACWIYRYFWKGRYKQALLSLIKKGWIYHDRDTNHYHLKLEIIKKLGTKKTFDS